MPEPASWTRAVFPLAIAPPALAAALLLPATLDPLAPLASAPARVWALIFLAAAGAAGTVLTARRALADPRARNRVLLLAGAAALVATALTSALALLLAKPLLVRGGGAWVLLAAGAIAVPLIASFALLEPAALFRWGLLAGECVVSAVLVLALGAPRAPDEYLRHVMLAAPGYGPASLGSLLPMRLAPPAPPEWELRMRVLDGMLARMIESGAFAPPHVEWGDDARVIRGFVAAIAAASPSMERDEKLAYQRIAVTERLLFAASPESRLEPWTKRGILVREALALTEDLAADEALRIRVSTAWTAMISVAEGEADPALEKEAIEAVRRLFAGAKLDRSHPIHLTTYALERRRLIEAGDAAGLLAFFDALAKEDFPADLKKAFEREAAFLRAHPGEDHRPAVALLRARILYNGGDGDRRAAAEAYEALLKTWPDSSVAPIARAELLELERG